MFLRLLLILAGALVPATAATIYNNGTPNGVGGTNFNDFRVVEDFSFASAASITGIRFWTTTQSSVVPSIADVTWAIYAESGGNPGALLHSGSANNVAGVLEFGQNVRRELSVSVNLLAGNYFLEVHTAPALNVAGALTTYWSFTADNATNRYRQGDLTSVPTIEANTGAGSGLLHAAFQLDGTLDSAQVPEPSSIALAAIGLAVLWRKRT